MDIIALILLFVGALLIAVGANTGNAACSRVGSTLLAVGFGIQLFGHAVR
jgi:hypothetical protein